jgi:hypothetical protein
MTEVAAFMMTIGFFASVATGATASASGVYPKPCEEIDLVARDELLREALRHIRVRPAGIPNDELHLAAGVRVAVDLHVRPHPRLDLLAESRGGSGEGRDHPDLEVLRERGGACQGKTMQQRCGEPWILLVPAPMIASYVLRGVERVVE